MQEKYRKDKGGSFSFCGLENTENIISSN